MSSPGPEVPLEPPVFDFNKHLAAQTGAVGAELSAGGLPLIQGPAATPYEWHVKGVVGSPIVEVKGQGHQSMVFAQAAASHAAAEHGQDQIFLAEARTVSDAAASSFSRAPESDSPQDAEVFEPVSVGPTQISEDGEAASKRRRESRRLGRKVIEFGRTKIADSVTNGRISSASKKKAAVSTKKEAAKKAVRTTSEQSSDLNEEASTRKVDVSDLMKHRKRLVNCGIVFASLLGANGIYGVFEHGHEFFDWGHLSNPVHSPMHDVEKIWDLGISIKHMI